jgi:osmotically-inducible protein OsmY
MIDNLKRTLGFVAVAVLVALTGCASTGDGSGSYLDDAAITARVKTAIFKDPTLKVVDISVRTEDKVVELSGSVKARADKVKAGDVAKRVDGVKRVKNDLTVQ